MRLRTTGSLIYNSALKSLSDHLNVSWRIDNPKLNQILKEKSVAVFALNEERNGVGLLEFINRNKLGLLDLGFRNLILKLANEHNEGIPEFQLYRIQKNGLERIALLGITELTNNAHTRSTFVGAILKFLTEKEKFLILAEENAVDDNKKGDDFTIKSLFQQFAFVLGLPEVEGIKVIGGKDGSPHNQNVQKLLYAAQDAGVDKKDFFLKGGNDFKEKSGLFVPSILHLAQEPNTL